MNTDKIIQQKFKSSFMSDSKWEKLIESLTGNLGEIFVNYKLIHDDSIYFTSFSITDFKPFFIEPILYKQVEWMEFPEVFNVEQNKRTTRRYIKEQKQDIDSIEKIINTVGKFLVEREDSSIKLYAYR